MLKSSGCKFIPVNKKKSKIPKGVISRFSADQPALKTQMVSLKSDWKTLNGGVAYHSGTYAPMLEDFYQYADFQALFDQYRVMSLTIHVVPSFSQFVPDVGAVNGFACPVARPIAVIAPDYDDSTAPATNSTGFEELIMKPNHKIIDLAGPTVSYTWQPKWKAEIDTVTGVSCLPTRARWMSTNSADVPMHGLKYWFNAAPSAAADAFVARVWITMDVEFRGQHAHLPGFKPPIVPDVPVVVPKDVEYIMVRKDAFKDALL